MESDAVRRIIRMVVFGSMGSPETSASIGLSNPHEQTLEGLVELLEAVGGVVTEIGRMVLEEKGPNDPVLLKALGHLLRWSCGVLWEASKIGAAGLRIPTTEVVERAGARVLAREDGDQL
jgi:hypothetical protein